MEIGAAVAGSVADVAGVRAPFDDADSDADAANADTTDSSDAASRRLGLIAAGSAAGISAGFGAPIAGLFFAFESILQPASARASAGLGGSTGFGQLTTESVILSSVLAAVVSSVLLGDQPAFVVPAFELKNVAELPLYLPLGLACGAVAVAFRASSRVLGADSRGSRIRRILSRLPLRMARSSVTLGYPGLGTLRSAGSSSASRACSSPR